ncbi:MAG: DIP1984 family protein [Blastocatellia bacterium]|nr:DIP1984 family protein [Blastocatellia bacterium]
MKLAEALIQRADAQKRFEQIKQRILQNAKVQQGDAPAENPSQLLAEVEEIGTRVVALVRKINQTNSLTEFEANETLADAIARRDGLLKRQGVYRELAAAAAVMHNVYMRSEVKFVSAVNVAEIQKTADALAQEYRELDSRIQALNWLTDLKE